MVPPSLCLTAMHWQDSGELGVDDLEMLLSRLHSHAEDSSMELAFLLDRQVVPLAS